jgi:hypothetical protein
LAVPIGETFEKPFLVLGRTYLVPGRTLLGAMWNSFHRGFYMDSKRVLPGTKTDYPTGTAEEPFWNLFFSECKV